MYNEKCVEMAKSHCLTHTQTHTYTRASEKAMQIALATRRKGLLSLTVYMPLYKCVCVCRLSALLAPDINFATLCYTLYCHATRKLHTAIVCLYIRVCVCVLHCAAPMVYWMHKIRGTPDAFANAEAQNKNLTLMDIRL